jgi:ABC-type nitrate/sulfonate/bicarbonate transport system substrate-binding protein
MAASRNARWNVGLGLFFVLVCLSASQAAQVGGKPEKSSLNISYAQASGAFTPLWVAQEEGLFKKQALDVSFK